MIFNLILPLIQTELTTMLLGNVLYQLDIVDGGRCMLRYICLDIPTQMQL
jgi:hypothetical protein